MKTVKVVAAVICNSFHHKEKVFATQRGYGKFKDFWEFPGGKVEEGETSVEAIKREIKEELDVEIDVGNLICTVEYDYPDFHLSMDCFWCVVSCGNLKLLEAENSAWLTRELLHSVEWLPADKTLLEKISLELV